VLLSSYVDPGMVSTQMFFLVNLYLNSFYLTCSTVKKWDMMYSLEMLTKVIFQVNGMGKFTLVTLGFQQETDFIVANDENSNDIRVGLIVFGDKSHTDLHGDFSLTPIIFTLTLFNRVSRKTPFFLETTGIYPKSWFWKE
jgi:hypothetical protein